MNRDYLKKDKRLFEAENLFDLVDLNSNNELSTLEWSSLLGWYDRDGDYTITLQELFWWLKANEHVICHDYQQLIDE